MILTAGLTFMNFSIDEMIIMSIDKVKNLSASLLDSSSLFLSVISVKIPPIALILFSES